jgi:hypothetical protein
MSTAADPRPISWRPTRKWMARTAVAIAGLASTAVSTGAWDKEESLMAITVVLAAVVSYLTPNETELTDEP